MNNQLPTKKNIFEGLQLMFYSNSNSLAGNSTWFGTGGYSGSYRLPDDTIAEKASDLFKSVGGFFAKLAKSTVLFSFYKVFTSPMPNI